MYGVRCCRGRYHSGSYLAATAIVTGSAAKSASVRKEMKYAELSNSYQFFPITIESQEP